MKKSFVLFALLVLLLPSCDFDDGFTNLNASVRRSGTQIIVKNNDNFDYKNLVIEINKEYKATFSFLPPGKVVEIGLLNFTDKKHNKFNPFTMDAANITITCDISGNKRGFLYGEMN